MVGVLGQCCAACELPRARWTLLFTAECWSDYSPLLDTLSGFPPRDGVLLVDGASGRPHRGHPHPRLLLLPQERVQQLRPRTQEGRL